MKLNKTQKLCLKITHIILKKILKNFNECEKNIYLFYNKDYDYAVPVDWYDLKLASNIIRELGLCDKMEDNFQGRTEKRNEKENSIR